MFDVYDLTTQRTIAEAIDLATAAELAMLDPDDLAWAVEEEGEATTDTHRVVPS
jgi:hypothetical protein